MTDFLPYWHFDKDFMVFSDGSLGAGFKLSSMDISCKSNEEINFFNKNVENFLKSLDESIRLQVFYRLSPDVSGIINTHRKISDLDSPILKDVNLSRISSFEKNMEGKNYFSTDVYLFIRSKPMVLKKQGLFQKTEKFVSVIDEDYKIFKDKFLKNFEKVFSSLSSLGLSPEVLKNEEWFSLIYEFLNLERFQKFGASSFRKEESLFPQSLSEVACQTDLSVSKDGLTLGDYKYKILSMKLVPDGTTYSAMVESLTKLPFHFWLVQNIEPLDQSKERSKLSLKRRIAHSMASGSEKLSDLESETKFSSIEDLLRELTNGTEKLISFDLNIILWDKDHRKLDEKTDKVTTAFRNMNNAEGITETYGTVLDLYGSIPKSKEEALQVLHDKSVAESFKMVAMTDDHSRLQEENADLIKINAREASLKGAARMTAESNALILDSLNQLIKLQAQSLKLQSEQLAMQNKNSKTQVDSFQKINQGLGDGFKKFQQNPGLTRF